MLLLLATTTWAMSPNNDNDIPICVNDKGAGTNTLNNFPPYNFSSANIPARAVALSPQIRYILANYLGWQPYPTSKNLCGGFYQEPLLVYQPSSAVAQGATKISANQASIFNQGKSTLRGKVIIEQQGKRLGADTAYIYRDAKTTKITHIDLYGQAQLREAGRLMLAQQGHFNLTDNSGYMENAVYRIALAQPQLTEGQIVKLFGVNGWGRAFKVTRQNNGNYQLEQATYATCPPQNEAWQLEAKQITLDKANGKGVARDMVFKIKGVPVFYTPYYSFPIDNRRRSGFLTPVVGYSNNSGAHLALPYYWNIAPNYDATLTPMYYSQRGGMMDGDFRYLTTNSSGEFSGAIMPHDQEFGEFINDNHLDGDSTTRDKLYFKDTTHINEHWAIDGIYQSVSDDYYLQDFSNSLESTTTNQLLRQGEITYSDEHWSGVSRVTDYLTLHPINQTSTQDIYSRYPQLIFDGHYNNLPGDFDLGINNEYNNFVWTGANQASMPAGSRYNFNPVLTRPFRNQWGYITPAVQLQAINYDLSRNVDSMGINDLPHNINLAVPQFSLDNGLYFDRNTSLWGKDFVQTLEPRLYYLYVPYVNQTQVPNFDSGYYIFTYDQMFRPNRFVGGDRVGDANQVTFAVSSRWLDSDTGNEILHFSVGDIYYLRDRQVQLMEQTSPTQVYADSPTTTLGYTSPTATFSPITAQAAVALNYAWHVLGDIAWDPDTHQTNNSNLNLHYQPEPNKIINVGYSYMVNGDTTGIANTATQSTNLHQITVSYAWPFTRNWSSIGAVGYNISHQYPMEYLVGAQYESCCYAVRIFGGKIYKNLSNTNQPVYSDSVYLQVLFKGLGTVASSNPAKLIAGNIAGYQDIFK